MRQHLAIAALAMWSFSLVDSNKGESQATNGERALLTRPDPGFGLQMGELRVVDSQRQAPIRAIDLRAGIYELRWVGRDGAEKSVTYQRPDAIDVAVEARVAWFRGRFEYSYTSRNMASSAETLAGVVIQTLADHVEPLASADTYVGRMRVPLFTPGIWLRFARRSDSGDPVSPGRSFEFRLISAAPPGLVKCAAHGGPLTIAGVGEDIPAELVALLPGDGAWPTGYTVGPVDRLTSMSDAERAIQFLAWTPELVKQRVGYTPASSDGYRSILVADPRMSTLRGEIQRDEAVGLVTSEVAALAIGLGR